MSEGNKTEKPTPKKLEDARKEGNFLFSEAIVTWTVLFFGILASYFVLSSLAGTFERCLAAAITLGNQPDFNAAAHNFWLILLRETLAPTALVFGTVMVFAIISNIGQVGFVFSGVKIRKGLSFEQGINPVSNAKNLFSKHTLARFIFSTIKVSLLLWFTYHTIVSDARFADQFWGGRMDELTGLSQVGALLVKVAFYALLITLPVCVLDWGVVALFYQNDNMMSHDELMKEIKETEGNPEIKSHRKAIAREILADHGRLANASAVVRNPTHIAVVLRYEPASSPMPYVMDMASGERALAIMQEAQKMGVPLHTDIPLARAVFATGAPNTHIPLALSEKVVPFIYWLQASHPDRVFTQSEFASLPGIGNVRR